MQERRNSIANALELRLSCTNPSLWSHINQSAFLTNHRKLNYLGAISSGISNSNKSYAISQKVQKYCLNFRIRSIWCARLRKVHRICNLNQPLQDLNIFYQLFFSELDYLNNDSTWHFNFSILKDNESSASWMLCPYRQCQIHCNWGWDEIGTISKTTFSNAYLGMKIYEFWLIFHWNLFPRVQLTIFHHWF